MSVVLYSLDRKKYFGGIFGDEFSVVLGIILVVECCLVDF